VGAVFLHVEDPIRGALGTHENEALRAISKAAPQTTDPDAQRVVQNRLPAERKKIAVSVWILFRCSS
jgi:hypothetical protein